MKRYLIRDMIVGYIYYCGRSHVEHGISGPRWCDDITHAEFFFNREAAEATRDTSIFADAEIVEVSIPDIRSATV